MKVYLSKRSLLGFFVIMAIIVLFGVVSYLQLEELAKSQSDVVHAYKVIVLLNSIEAAVLDIFIDTRTFVMTGEEKFIADHDYDWTQNAEKMNQLEEFTQDKAIQQSNIETLKDLLEKRQEVSSNIIETRKRSGYDDAAKLVISDSTLKINEQINQQISSMISLEEELLQKRLENSKIDTQTKYSTLFIGRIIIIAVLIFLLILSNKDVKNTIEANRKLLSEKEKSETLYETDKLKEEFSTMITHELKTPLAPIIGYCKMLKNQMLGNISKEQSDTIDIIERNAKRLEDLITDIMDARKLDIDKMKFYMDEIQLDEFFDALNSNYKPILQQRGQEFVINAAVKDSTIKSDKTRLRQVFDNLISNAIKFMPEENGRIEIGLQEEDRNLIFYIKDNGIGIPPEAQQNLFKKFYQVDTSERRKIGGTGLGLAISKGIIEKLNGTITVESDGKTGTTFYIKLPKE